jgi:cytoskeletal protein CcmA (bactofilin family)
MSTYVNDLRLEEIGTGEASGTWGTKSNVSLELIGEALGYGTEAITTNADTHTSTIADGATDPVRAMFVKYTGTLDSACTITIAPNTICRMQFIENATSGSQNIIISQGSGANITIPAGDVKAVYLDGAGSGAAVVDAFASLSVVDLKVQDDLTVTDDLTVNGDIDLAGSIDVDGTANLDVVDIDGAVDMASTLAVTGIVTLTDDLIIGDGKTIGSASDVDAITIASNGQLTLTQTLIGTALDISGDIDIDGTTNLDVVDIDGAVDMATTLTLAGNADFNGDLDVDGTTNLDVVDIDGAVDMASTLQVDGAITSSAGATITVADNTNNLSIVSTDADADNGPNVRFYRNSSSPADDDLVGGIVFDSRNDNSQDIQPVRIRVYTPDVSDGTEDSALDIATMTAGALGNRLDILPTETIINNGSIDADFRVESNGQTHALVVDGALDNVGVGYSSAHTATLTKVVAILSGGAGGGIQINREDGTLS